MEAAAVDLAVVVEFLAASDYSTVLEALEGFALKSSERREMSKIDDGEQQQIEIINKQWGKRKGNKLFRELIEEMQTNEKNKNITNESKREGIIIIKLYY